MAPSQSQVVTFVASSALIVGVLFTLYLIKKRKQAREQRDKSRSRSAERDASNNATEEPEKPAGSVPVVDTVEEHQDFVPQSDDESGEPMQGLTVSTSWAILNANSDTSSPHLSPVDSEESEHDMTSQDDSNMFDDDTQHNTVLEVSSSESTILVEKDVAVQMREQEECSVETLTIKYEELLKEHKMSSKEKFTREEIMEALMAAQKPSEGLTHRHAEVLVGLLGYEDIHLKNTAVQGISNCAAFANNQNVLREKGCLSNLSKLLELQHMAMWLRHPNAATTINTTITAVANMAVNADNQKQMEACVPTLVDISLDRGSGDSVCLTSLQALTNLSVTSDHHGHYTRLVLRLYEFLQTDNTAIRLQSLKILINLSCNAEMVPHLLAAKAPEGLLKFLLPSETDDTVILRFITLLANILYVVKERNISSSSLPSEDKAASPETMYSAILGISNVGNLKNKVFLLCKHTNEEIRRQAATVYNQLK